MRFKFIFKLVIFFVIAYYLFPTFNNGFVVGLLLFMCYVVIVGFVALLIDEVIDYLDNNWRKGYLNYIDEREHVKGNSLANLSRFDILGWGLRLFHKILRDRKRLIWELYYNFLESKAVYITTFICFILLITYLSFMLFF